MQNIGLTLTPLEDRSSFDLLLSEVTNADLASPAEAAINPKWMHVRLSFSDELHVPDAHTVLLVCEVKYHKMFRCSVYNGLRDKAPWVRG